MMKSNIPNMCREGEPMRWIGILLAALFGAAGCASTGPAESNPVAVAAVDPALSVQTITITAKGGALKLDSKEYFVREFDRNSDKKPDIINVYKKKGPVQEEGADDSPLLFIKIMDLNLDVRYDVYRFYDESGAVVKEELDLDFDGKIETVNHYRGGVVVLKEIDSQFDEKTDIWKYYDENGVLVRLEEDQDGDGRVDYWETYSGGVLERVEKDTDRDGKPDIYKRAGDQKFISIIRNDGQFGSEGPQQPSDAASPNPVVPETGK